ncbi:MAG: SH3 domain-containing protein, partial [Bacteroidales bacterium]|nr:SH3 domain-containing protein [Bacteroidales bacterium]
TTTTTTTTQSTSTFTPYKVKVTTGVLNIRNGAGTNYGINGTIKDKGVYTIVDEATGNGATKWLKLKSGAGWIASDYTKKV